MSDSTNSFFWYELMTTDTAGAKAFYKDVVGWDMESADPPNDAYTLLKVDGQGVAGLMEMPGDMCENGGRPGWMGYIHVDDTDAAVERIIAAGGRTYCPPTDIPGIGRFAVVADPHGAVFNIMKPMPRTDDGCSAPEPPAPNAPGTTGWRELHAGDGPEAWAFYSGLFGWEKTGAMPMGELGEYLLFGRDGVAAGAIMTKMAETPAPFWNFYFNVPSIESAVERIQAAGGRIILEPMEVPGPMWIVQGTDPQGAMFALVAPAK